VNEQSMRLVKQLDSWSRAAISRRLAEAVVGGKDLMSAVVAVFEALQTAPGRLSRLGTENIDRKEMSIEGIVTSYGTAVHRPFSNPKSSKIK
jgi:hypothetical protein